MDDLHVPGMLHATVVRSPHAHARLREIDAAAAREAPGVAAVFTAGDLMDALRPIPIRLVPDDRLLRYLQHPLAVDRVRYVGEPVALVVARSRAAAEDAAERVEVGFEPLPAATDAGSPPPAALFDHTPDNVASLIEEGFGDPDAAFARAHRIVRLTFRTGRHTAVPMETRGLVAAPDRGAAHGRGRLTIWGPTKVTHFNRGVLAAMLGWPEHRIRLVEPEVGGGFGARGRVLSRGLPRPLRGAPARAAGQVDRGSGRAPERHQPFPRAVLRARPCARPGRPVPRSPGGDDQRHGGVPAHPRDGGAGAERRHAPRPVRDGGVPVPGPLRAHQQDPDRHLPRPRPFRVQCRARTAHRSGRPGDRDRSRRAADAEPHPPGADAVRARDHHPR